MASEQDDFGLTSYQAITAHLSQWGDSAPPSTSRKSARSSLSSSGTPFHDAYETAVDMDMMQSPETPARPVRDLGHDVDMEEDEETDRVSDKNKGGVETPMPVRYEHALEESAHDDDDDDVQQQQQQQEPVFVDGVDPYQPYRDALLSYLQNRQRISNLSSAEEEESSSGLMQIDDGRAKPITTEDSAALEDADMKFLDALSSICFSRSAELSTADCREGNLWDLMSSLRSRGLSSLFYRVNDESLPELILNADPKEMMDASPAQVVNACLGNTQDKPASLPIERLNAALEWIQSCHHRKWQTMMSRDYVTSNDPLLPPPRRRTMWPSTLEAMKKNGSNTTTQNFYPDAPLLARSNSPTSSAVLPLDPSDESDDARLLRACFILIQAGRHEQAIQLTKDCGQPWRSIAWLGCEPLDEYGNGNPTRRLWKRTARKVLRQMMQTVHCGEGVSSRLQSAQAYECAILAILSEDVESASRNPAFCSWEDGVHAILSAERGLVEENVLLAHDDARVDAVGEGCFPYAGMEGGNDVSLGGYDGDLGAALQKLNVWSVDKVREGSGDAFRNGMQAFLIGREALKEYIEEIAYMALDLNEDDHPEILRFAVHLVLYVDTVLPEFAFQLRIPENRANVADSLREALLLKYANYLSSMRELWSYVPLYTSLMSDENILATFSDFLLHVHNDQERQMLLGQARDFFHSGFDRCVLRIVVREMIQSDKETWLRGIGEDASPPGIAPADARMMRSVLWLCYYEEHHPDALVCANMLLRRFMIEAESDNYHTKKYLRASKYFVSQILPRDLVQSAGVQSEQMGETIAGYLSLQTMQNLQAEFLSIKHFLQAHTHYVNFLDVISKTSPCHQTESKTVKGASSYETEIAQKMERNAFRQKKTGLCKIVIEYATKASDALVTVLTVGGGWLVDQTLNGEDETDVSEEARSRADDLHQIRSVFVPMAIFMLHEVLNKTAMWMEQVVHDTVDQFGDASPDMLFTLFSTFDDSEEVTARMLKTSPAAPAYWHKKAVSMASIVANDDHELHEAVGDKDIQKLLGLVADSQVKYIECSDADALFDL
ncbi:hypothetical protein ACHAXN_013425 [Cyclotella atomus]